MSFMSSVCGCDLSSVVPVTVASQPANVMSSESATASFSCNLKGIPAPTITWFKGTTVRQQTLPTQSLAIT